MILDDYFERIVILSLPQSRDRAERAQRELRSKKLTESAVVVRAVDGRISRPSGWWQAGNGSWGCMQSHYRVVQDALLDGVKTLLVLEDDCIWQMDAAERLAEFLPQVPSDWGQIYLGGQHRNGHLPQMLPESSCVMKVRRAHRTHAYAISTEAMVPFLQHILYAPDYIEAAQKNGWHWHVDHQLERAQNRGDWTTYCPSWWLAGQGENHSLISGRQNKDQWWQLNSVSDFSRFPLIICDGRPDTEQQKWMHFGKNLMKSDPIVDVGVRDCSSAEDLSRILRSLATEAISDQRLPAILNYHEKADWAKAEWPGPVLYLGDFPDLEGLCHYPQSRIIPHPWWNPKHAPRITVEEPSDSTDQLNAAEAPEQVHQVWIGAKVMPPRLAAYCETIRQAFPGWKYRFWVEEDMEQLSQNSLFPEIVRGDTTLGIGIRADIVRLEILRQHGGIYLDVDFEALRPDLRPLFQRQGCFYYADEQAGHPTNALLGTHETYNGVVELYLRRIAARLRKDPQGESVLWTTGPQGFSEALGGWTDGEWTKQEVYAVNGEAVADVYAAGSLIAIYAEVACPYSHRGGSFAAFDPANSPQAWLAHHWSNTWRSNIL